MKIFDYLATVDRRIIYFILAIVVILPLVFPKAQSVRVMTPARRLFEAVDSIPENKVLLIDFDYDPQTQPENEPMAIALLRHSFNKRIKVAALSLYAQPVGLAVQALNQVSEEFNSRAQTHEDSIIYGRDYILLGWQPPPILPLLGLGVSISNVYPTDHYGYTTDSLPVMQDIRNLNDVGILVSVSGGSAPLWWVAYSQVRYGVAVGAGLTAVSASDYFIYYQTGQFSGLMVGMKGAAEYEEMVSTLEVPGRRRASEALGSLTAAHLTIMAFIIIGNIGYIVRRRRK
jgi:hypothetical protein